MLSVERHRLLLQHLRAHGSRNVASLARALGVSESTVRRDLRDLHERGLLVRVHGGASVSQPTGDGSLSARVLDHTDEKERIGRAAARLVHDNTAVLITGGSTTAAMLDHIGDRVGLTVVTNGLDIALHLGRFPAVSVVVLGGVLRHDELALLGPIAEQVLNEFHVDVAFCGAYGIDAVVGLSAADVATAGVDRRILHRAGRLVVLADSSKFGRRGPVRLAETEHIAYLITDRGAPPKALAALRHRGVDVVTC